MDTYSTQLVLERSRGGMANTINNMTRAGMLEEKMAKATMPDEEMSNPKVPNENPTIEDHLTTLPKLGLAIDNTLTEWETYLEEISSQPSYGMISFNDTADTSSKIEALQYLLSGLPLRYAALIKSCSDPNLELVGLPDRCVSLLKELLSMKSEVDMGKEYALLVKNKRFVDRVTLLEKGIKDEELFRKQELNRLKGLHMSLMYVRDDGGDVPQKDFVALLDAMEALGVSIMGFGIQGEGENGG
jgi:hypothetical protein